MGRPLRLQDPSFIYFITNRTLESRFFLSPGQNNLLSQFILKLLADSQRKYQVEIFSFVFLSNHFHLILRAPHLNLSEFMSHFQSRLARFINALRQRRGTVFPNRYDANFIADDAALLSLTLYLLANPTRARLVEHPDQWPSLISHHAYSPNPSPYDAIPLTPLPLFPDLQTQQAVLSPLIDDHCDRLVQNAAQSRQPFLGPSRVRRTPWHDQPASYSTAPSKRRTLNDRVMCHAFQIRRQFVTHLRAVIDAYHAVRPHFRGEAFARFCQRAGVPAGTHHPRNSWCVGGAVGAVG